MKFLDKFINGVKRGFRGFTDLLTGTAVIALASLGTVAAIALWLGLGPLLTILSLNILFGFGIPYTFQTWAATFFLVGYLGSKFSFKRS